MKEETIMVCREYSIYWETEGARMDAVSAATAGHTLDMEPGWRAEFTGTTIVVDSFSTESGKTITIDGKQYKLIET